MTLPPPVLAIFQNISGTEIIVIALLVVLLFGAHKIPELARSLGKAQREFQKARDAATQELEAAPTEAERIQKAARDLGISTEGKSVDELKLEIAQRLK